MKKIISTICRSTTLTEHQAWWLLEHITKKTAIELRYTSQEKLLDDQQKLLDQAIIDIFVHNKPLAYILGTMPFLDLLLDVQAPTLIPRPETEYWVADLITNLRKTGVKKLTILDIGTGSGCIALALAQAFKQAHVYAIDIAPAAIKLAEQNGKKNDLHNVTFLQSNLFESLPTDLKFDLIVSNPPYIDPAIQLDQSVIAWEDYNALFAQNQGLAVIEKIIEQAPNHLNLHPIFSHQLIIEVDSLHAKTVANIARKNNFIIHDIQQDQFARDRTIWAKL